LPRPRVHEDLRVVSFSLEKEMVEKLDLLARQEGISRSELLRRVVEEWLIKQPINYKKKQPPAGGLTLRQKIKQKYYEMEFEETLSDIEGRMEELRTYQYYRKKPDLRFHDIVGYINKKIKKLVQLVNKVDNGSNNLKELLLLQEEFNKLKKAPWWREK